MANVNCPKCRTRFNPRNHPVRAGAAAAGAAAGAYVGAGVGIAGGPLGAMAGTVRAATARAARERRRVALGHERVVGTEGAFARPSGRIAWRR